MGNGGSLIEKILKLKYIKLIGVVADKTSEVEKRYFGSAFSIGKKLKVPVISQNSFNKNYNNYLKNIFQNIDIIFVQGYHHKIKKGILKNEKIKVINFHQSLLPKYAGRHPLNWAIINGEKVTGITFHYVNENFDEGDIILQKKIRVFKDDAVQLYKKTIKSASRYIKKVFELIYDNSFISIKQDLTKREYFPPRKPTDGEILKDDSIEQIKNKIKALVFPYPGAFIHLNGKKVIIDQVVSVKKIKKYRDIGFVGKYNSNIILKAGDGLLKVTKFRNGMVNMRIY